MSESKMNNIESFINLINLRRHLTAWNGLYCGSVVPTSIF